MNEIRDLLKEYSIHVLNDGDESNKCDCLSNSDLFGEYADCWLLLSILFKELDAPPFYSIRPGKIDKDYQILRIKFLVWLERIYRDSHEISQENMNPIKFIRRSDYHNFFECYGKKFASWKVETFRIFFDSDLSSSNKSFMNFKQNLKLLINEPQFNQSEKEIFEALDGQKDIILRLLQRDIIIDESQFTQSLKEIFEALRRKKYIFLRLLQKDRIIDELQLDQSEKEIYEMLKEKKEIILKLLQTYTILDESQFDPSEKEIYEALNEKKDMIIKLFIDPYDDMWADLFASYSNETILPESFSVQEVQKFTAFDFQKYCFKLDIFQKLHEDRIISESSSKIDIDSLAFYFNLGIIFKNKKLSSFLLCSYLSLLYRFKCYKDIFKYTYFLNPKLFSIEESRESVSYVASLFDPDLFFLDALRKKKIDEVQNLLLDILNQIKSKNQRDTLKALKWSKLDINIKDKILELVVDYFKKIYKNGKSYYTIQKEILTDLKSVSLSDYFDIQDNNYDEITKESLASLAADLIINYNCTKDSVCKEYISDLLENEFWYSFLDIQDQSESKNQKDYLRALKWLKLDECVKDDFLQLAIDCTYELVMQNKFLEARETYEMIKEEISDDLERDFWNSFLPLSDEENINEKMISSFKQLLLWTASMKEYDYYPYGYETCITPEESLRRTNRLINHLICYITNTYQQKLNEDILFGNQI